QLGTELRCNTVHIPPHLLSVSLGGMLRGGWAQSGWDMYVPPQIMGLRGDSIVLPCNFTHPKPNYTGDIQVIWKPDIFQCLVSNSSTKTRSFDNCTTGQGPSGRYRLAGDPQRHNLSLHITGLRYEDSKGYMCRVVLRQNPAWAYENKMAIMLSVEARPSILNLTLLPGPLPVQVACTAEGNPVPNITWLGLAGSEVGQLQNTTGPQYQTTQVLSVSRIGTYTCRAENVHGQAERSVLVGPMGPPLLLIILLPAALLLLAGLLLLVLCCRWKGRGVVHPGQPPQRARASSGVAAARASAQHHTPEPPSKAGHAAGKPSLCPMMHCPRRATPVTPAPEHRTRRALRVPGG
uniref:Ig-like domain-containing protein n=1 Tax=Chelonoidis abingdonii TaxID=106734 RepID=A0A8C0H2I3_CHEAB